MVGVGDPKRRPPQRPVGLHHLDPVRIAFLAQTAYLFTIMGIEIAADERSALLYGVIGSHLVLTLAAMGFAVVVGFRTLGGEYSSRDHDGVLSAALFWTVVAALYGVLWYVIYITK